MQQHVWLTDEFSVRLEDLCWREKGKSGFRCIHGKNHKGACRFAKPDVRLYSAQERRAP